MAELAVCQWPTSRDELPESVGQIETEGRFEPAATRKSLWF
jgi:hypothetical protein